MDTSASLFELNEETKWILGRPNFVCGGLAQDLRKCGKEIPLKAEEEQAHVIYWMLEMYTEYGSDWKKMGNRWIKDNIVK